MSGRRGEYFRAIFTIRKKVSLMKGAKDLVDGAGME